MGSISLLLHDAYAQAVNADSTSAIFKAVITVFFTNGLIEAILAAFVTSIVALPLFKLSNSKLYF